MVPGPPLVYNKPRDSASLVVHHVAAVGAFRDIPLVGERRVAVGTAHGLLLLLRVHVPREDHDVPIKSVSGNQPGGEAVCDRGFGDLLGDGEGGGDQSDGGLLPPLDEPHHPHALPLLGIPYPGDRDQVEAQEEDRTAPDRESGSRTGDAEDQENRPDRGQNYGAQGEAQRAPDLGSYHVFFHVPPYEGCSLWMRSGP